MPAEHIVVNTPLRHNKKFRTMSFKTCCNEIVNWKTVRLFHLFYIIESTNSVSMKEIKGLNERLLSLKQRLSIVKQLTQDQTDMAQVSCKKI